MNTIINIDRGRVKYNFLKSDYPIICGIEIKKKLKKTLKIIVNQTIELIMEFTILYIKLKIILHHVGSYELIV